MTCFYSGALVYGPGPAPGVETVLDLSAVVGANARLVRLKFKCDAGPLQVHIKPGAGSGIDPFPESWSETGGYAGGCTRAEVAAANECVALRVTTDDLGCIRWVCPGGGNWTVWLQMYWDDPVAWTNVHPMGPIPAAWTPINLGVTANERMAFMRVLRNSVVRTYLEMRSSGEVNPVVYGCSQSSGTAAGTANGLAVMAVGDLVEAYAYSADNWQIDVGHISLSWVDTRADPANPIFPSAAPPLIRTTLDLSPIVGSQRVIALLRLHGTNNPAFQPFAFAPTDDADVYSMGSGTVGGIPNPTGEQGAWLYLWAPGWEYQYAIVLTDAAGCTDWLSSQIWNVEISVLGYDVATVNAPPTITDWYPTGADEAPLVHVAFKDDDDVGVVSNTQALTLTPPIGAPFSPLVSGAAALPHWIATITPNGTATGYTVVLTHTVDLYPPGGWAADAYCEDGGGLSASKHWHFGVAAFSFVEGAQVRLNAVRVELDDEPTHSDPSLVTDGLCLSIYTVAGPSAPLLQCVTWDLADPNALTLWFDGPLVPGETYAITVAAGLKSTSGLSLFPAVTFSFVAFGEDRAPVPLRLQQAESYDLRNPQSVLDGDTGVPLAQLIVDETGDLDVEGRLAALKKRCFRRLSTLRSAFVHLPGYGLGNRLKTLARPSDLRRLQQDAAAQLAQEPDVTRVRVTVSQPGPGETVITAQVTAPYGTVDLEVSP